MPRATPQRLPRLADSPGPFDGRVLTRGEDVVAVGGEVEPGLVWHAYRHGVFPWYEEGGPVVWWCPDPRGVLPLTGLHVARRLERTLRRGDFEVTTDTAFADVVACAATGRDEGTWIHPEVAACYRALHAEGRARSFEVWRAGRLVGGLFGLPLGRVFCAESMFQRERDMSKVALVHAVRRLAEEGVELLEVQFVTPHLARLGAVLMARSDYLAYLTPRAP
jgi:leucyl/phenylalanyl-tRNA--protein transferase